MKVNEGTRQSSVHTQLSELGSLKLTPHPIREGHLSSETASDLARATRKWESLDPNPGFLSSQAGLPTVRQAALINVFFFFLPLVLVKKKTKTKTLKKNVKVQVNVKFTILPIFKCTVQKC